MAIGIWRPTILFPLGLEDQLSEDELDHVALHELGHLRRWDDWTRLAQRLAEAMLFLQPAVHLIGRRLNLEREIACDDRVVAVTGKPKPYASCLTRLAELSGGAPVSALAPGALLGRKHLSRRIEMLLDSNRQLGRRFSRLGFAAAVGALSAGLFALSHFAPLAAALPPISAPAPPEPGLEVEPLPEQPAPPSATAREREAARERAKVARELARKEQELRREYEARAEEMAAEWRAVEEAMTRAAEELRREPQPPMAYPLPPQFVLSEGEEPAVSESEILSLLVGIARNDSSPEVREAALRELAGFRTEAGVEALVSLYDATQDDKVKESILHYLARNAGKAAIEKLKAIAKSDPQAERRLLAVRLLGMLSRAPRGMPYGPVVGVPLPPEPPAPPAAPAPPAPPAPPKSKPKPPQEPGG